MAFTFSGNIGSGVGGGRPGGITMSIEALDRATATITAVSAKIDALGAATNRTTVQTAKMNKGLHSMLAVTRGMFIRLIAMAAAMAAVGLATRGTIGAAIDFENSFTGIRKTMDLTEREFRKLEQANRDLAKVIPINVNEINELGEIAGQLGIRGVANIERFEKAIGIIGVTTNIAANAAATDFARIAAVMKLPIANVDNMAATVVDLGNNLETSEKEIVNFATRIAGAAAAVGLTTANILSIGAAFTAVGVPVERGGTAVQKVLLAMQKALAESGKELDVFHTLLGVTAEEFRQLLREDPLEAFVQFVERLQLTGEDAIRILDALGLSDQRLIGAFLAMGAAGDKLRTSVERGNIAFEAGDAHLIEFNKRVKTATSQAQLMRNNWNDVGITLGRQVLPVLVKLSHFMVGVAQAIDLVAIPKIRQGFKDWSPVLQQVADDLQRAGDATQRFGNYLIQNQAHIVAAIFLIGRAFTFIFPGGPLLVGLVAAAALLVIFRTDLETLSPAVLAFEIRMLEAVVSMSKFVIVGGLVAAVLAAIAGNLPLAVAAIGGTAAALAAADFATDRLEDLNFQLALTSRAALSIDDLRRALARADGPVVTITNSATGLAHIMSDVTAQSELVRLEWEAMARAADAAGEPFEKFGKRLILITRIAAAVQNLAAAFEIGAPAGVLQGRIRNLQWLQEQLEALDDIAGVSDETALDLGDLLDSLGKTAKEVDILADGIIDLWEAIEHGISMVQAVILEQEHELTVAANRAWRATIDLIKAEQQLTNLEGIRIETLVALTESQAENAQAARANRVELRKLYITLLDTQTALRGAARLLEETQIAAAQSTIVLNAELVALGVQLGQQGLITDASSLRFAIAILGEEFQQAEETMIGFHHRLAQAALNAVQTRFDALFNRPTREQAQLNLALAEAQRRRVLLEQSGNEGLIEVVDAEIERIQHAIDLRRAEENIMKARADVVNALLLTEQEQMNQAQLLIGMIATQSALTDTLNTWLGWEVLALAGSVGALGDFTAALIAARDSIGGGGRTEGFAVAGAAGRSALGAGSPALTFSVQVNVDPQLADLERVVLATVEEQMREQLQDAGLGGSSVSTGTYRPEG